MPGAGAGCASRDRARAAASHRERRDDAEARQPAPRRRHHGFTGRMPTMSPDLVSTTTAMSWLRAFIGRNPIASSARPDAATNARIAAASCGWRFASSANGFAAWPASRRNCCVRHVEIGKIGEIGAALRRRRSRCRPAASGRRAGARPPPFGPVSGSDRNSGAAFSRDASSIAFAAIDLEAVDDEDVVDGPRARTSRCSRRRAPPAAAARSPRDRTAGSSSSGRRR